jgi:hypothetical protein
MEKGKKLKRKRKIENGCTEGQREGGDLTSIKRGSSIRM